MSTYLIRWSFVSASKLLPFSLICEVQFNLPTFNLRCKGSYFLAFHHILLELEALIFVAYMSSWKWRNPLAARPACLASASSATNVPAVDVDFPFIDLHSRSQAMMTWVPCLILNQWFSSFSVLKWLLLNTCKLCLLILKCYPKDPKNMSEVTNAIENNVTFSLTCVTGRVQCRWRSAIF